MNSNGLRLLSLCAKQHLVITNTIFQMKNRLKTTWQHPRSKRWHFLDYAIVHQESRQAVLATQVKRGAECWINHVMVISKLHMNIRPRCLKTARTRRLNCAALNSFPTSANLRQLYASVARRSGLRWASNLRPLVNSHFDQLSHNAWRRCGSKRY